MSKLSGVTPFRGLGKIRKLDTPLVRAHEYWLTNNLGPLKKRLHPKAITTAWESLRDTARRPDQARDHYKDLWDRLEAFDVNNTCYLLEHVKPIPIKAQLLYLSFFSRHVGIISTLTFHRQWPPLLQLEINRARRRFFEPQSFRRAPPRGFADYFTQEGWSSLAS